MTETKKLTAIEPYEGWDKWIAKPDNSQTIPEKPIYLATVYSNYIKLFPELTVEEALEEAYQAACEQLAIFLKAGIFTYCPIAHNHGASKYVNILEHSFWLPKDFQFIRLCRALVVYKMPSWEESFGISEEIKLATSLNIPIYYCNFGEISVELRT